MKKIILLLTILATAITTRLFAQAGTLDGDFNGGTVITPIGMADDSSSAVAIQPDGKIIVAGSSWNGLNSDFALARYNADGTLDNGFGTDGKVTTPIGEADDYAHAVVIQSDGKIVVAGTSYNAADADFGVARYNSDGTLDNSFSTDGKLTTSIGAHEEAYSVAIQPDEKIVVVGFSLFNGFCYFALVRYNSNGKLDKSFIRDGSMASAVGGPYSPAFSVAIQSDGKIVVAGFSLWKAPKKDFALARYEPDGAFDNTFGDEGQLTTTIDLGIACAVSIAIQSNGKIVVAGYSYNGSNFDFALARYISNGTLDNGFSTDGKLTTAIGSGDDKGYSVAIQPDGKIVVAGSSYNGSNNDFALVRYNSDGTLDNTFGADGKSTTAIGTGFDDAYSVAIQSDAKIVVAGNSSNGLNQDFAIARYFSEGIICSPCAIPNNLHSTNTTQTRTTLNWNKQPCAIGYKIMYRTQGSAQWTTLNIDTNVSFKAISGLKANTIYEWRIKTKCRDGIFNSNTCIQTFLTDFDQISESGHHLTGKELLKEILIYPNQASSQITVDVSDFEGSAQLNIFSILGVNVRKMELQLERDKTILLDIQSLPAGTYEIKINNDSEYRVGRFVKQ
ncbi:MAG TPA: T9SS type A sorting domain-containing protein [Chitinophagales bacterium]|nr:T9SS type A sorting domain-containing protein [Chitinophagales bacterium]